MDSQLGSAAEISERYSVTSYDSASFTAGQDAGARVSACLARLAALQLVEDSTWWNRRRHRLMARALVACADEMESTADADAIVPGHPPDARDQTVTSARAPAGV
jgi:hypothetical protein